MCFGGHNFEVGYAVDRSSERGRFSTRSLRDGGFDLDESVYWIFKNPTHSLARPALANRTTNGRCSSTSLVLSPRCRLPLTACDSVPHHGAVVRVQPFFVHAVFTQSERDTAVCFSVLPLAKLSFMMLHPKTVETDVKHQRENS